MSEGVGAFTTTGYWNKLHAGKVVKATPLPPRPPGISDTITIGAWDYREHNRRLMETEPKALVFDEPIETLRERISRNIGVVAASKNRSPPHAAFRRQIEDDVSRAQQSSCHTPIFDSPVEKRRLRILQGLFYGLGRLDCSVTVQGRETRAIYIGVGQQTVSIALERAATRRRVPDGKDAERLKFSILKGSGSDFERLSWTDADDHPLEWHLSAIAVEIIVVGEMQYREHLVWVYEELIRRREEMRQAEIKRCLEAEEAERKRLIKIEADRLKRLADSAGSFHRAQTIREFVTSVVSRNAEHVDSELVDRWKSWALVQADKLDPIATGRTWNDMQDSS